MRWCFSVNVVILLISSACKKEINEGNTQQFADLDSIINVIESRLFPLEEDIDQLTNFTEELFQNQEFYIQKAEKERYKISEDGVVFKEDVQPYESGVYVAANTPNREKALQQLYYTEAMDSLLRIIKNKTPFISQVYFNTKLQMCRIYPEFDVLNIADANLDLTSFNFYYLADEVRNPERESRWVEEVYIDPAGRGWILSLIHPVYYLGDLKGVLGIDITVKDLFQQFLNIKGKKIVIVDGSGTVVAGTSAAIETLNLPR
ncbi:cysteine protease [Echinicola jeungdonensis]|uniref:cysteine protease n=1 Tax=Echinicola jeungdonensis TaxID=709343 RepID=UPI0025B3DA80|nr:cysteine protease [Echinicola jeungdonensis]MDN3670201.1 cysteine protease [Echinicola jeungdonensis]